MSPEQVHIIRLDASRWETVHHFYDALLLALGAPKGHGRNVNALVDSMIWGGMNSVNPPYCVELLNATQAPLNVSEHLRVAEEAIREGRAYFRSIKGYDVEVEMKVIP